MTQGTSSDIAPSAPYLEKSPRDLMLLGPTEVVLLIRPSLDRTVIPHPHPQL